MRRTSAGRRRGCLLGVFIQHEWLFVAALPVHRHFSPEIVGQRYAFGTNSLPSGPHFALIDPTNVHKTMKRQYPRKYLQKSSPNEGKGYRSELGIPSVYYEKILYKRSYSSSFTSQGLAWRSRSLKVRAGFFPLCSSICSCTQTSYTGASTSRITPIAIGSSTPSIMASIECR